VVLVAAAAADKSSSTAHVPRKDDRMSSDGDDVHPYVEPVTTSSKAKSKSTLSKKPLDNFSAGDGDAALIIKLPEERKLSLESDGNDSGTGTGTHSLAHAVEEAYAFSSRALLRLLEQQYGLSGHLRSLRRFFLLEHGDFFIQFMDIADEVSSDRSVDVIDCEFVPSDCGPSHIF
jgi:hypothetical protein